MDKVFSYRTCPPAKHLRCASFRQFKALPLLRFYHNLESSKRLLHALLAAIRQILSSIWILRLCALSGTTVFQQFRLGCNSDSSLGLHTPCTTPVLNFHFWENENKVTSPNLVETNSESCQCTPCGQFHCTPCRKTLAQTEKQLKLILYSPSL
jgi:hypothetical protein